MLGNHVNVSARNRTLFMKFLRVFLAVVLLGLMIPHGISSSLNAYAGDAEEPATETTDPVVTEEDPVAEEEVTPADPAPATPVLNATFKISADAGDGYFTDFTGKPDKFFFEELIEGTSDHYKKICYNFDTETEEDKTYAGAVSHFNNDIEGGQFGELVHQPDSTRFVNFKLPEGIDPAEEVNKECVCNTTYATSIIINNASGHENAKLMFDSGYGTFQEVSWGEQGDYDRVIYGSQFVIDTTNKTLKVKTYLGSDYVYKVEGDNDFKGFASADEGETITAKKEFTAEYNDGSTVFIKFKPESDTEGEHEPLNPPEGKSWLTIADLSDISVDKGSTIKYEYGKYESYFVITKSDGSSYKVKIQASLNGKFTDESTFGSGYGPFDFGKEATVINEDTTIHYRIVERDKINVEFATNGATTISEEPTAVAPTEGGGNWTTSEETPVAATYSNTFYEDTDYSKILEHWTNVELDKPSGFFTGWDNQEGTLTAETTWNAQFDVAAHVTVNVKESKPDSPAALANMVVVLENQDKDIAPGTKSVTGVVTATAGSYDLKVYGHSKYQEYITGDLTAGGQGYIEQSGELVEGDWNASASATKEFALDKGYSFFASDLYSLWYAKYYTKDYNVSPYIYAHNVGTEGDQAVLGDNASLQFSSLNNIKQDSGNEIIISTSTTSGQFKVEVPNLLTEDVAIKSNKFIYTCWLETTLNLKNSNGEEAKKFSRIDYRIPWEDYISVSGPVTDKETGLPLSGIKVSYSATNSNEPVEEKYTNEDGYYYVVIKTLQGDEKGTVLFEDVDGDSNDHLDERVRLSSKDTSDIRPTSPADSGDWSKPAMIPAVHVTGKVMIEKPGTEEPLTPAVGAYVSFSMEEEPPAEPDAYIWNGFIHSPTYVDAQGNYSLKLKKSDTDEGGCVYFNLAGYAQSGHDLIQDGQKFKHDTDISGMNDNLAEEGATVDIKGDGLGFKGFTVRYFEGTNNYKTIEHAITLAETKFAKYGEFSTAYGANGSLLKYVYKSPVLAEFSITVEPEANDSYTYWAWRCTNRTATSETDWFTWTLMDQDKIDHEKLESGKFTFTADFAEATSVTVGGAGSPGHDGWLLDLAVTSGGVPGQSAQYPVGTNDYTFSIPVTQNQTEYSNETNEPINLGYSYDGQAISLNLSTTFTTSTGAQVPYTETRSFTPIAASGYMFTGIAVNGVDLVNGQSVDIAQGDDTPLNIVAKYAEIPNVAQTGDNNNFWWLFALVAITLAGVAYAGTRKQKGIRR